MEVGCDRIGKRPWVRPSGGKEDIVTLEEGHAGAHLLEQGFESDPHAAAHLHSSTRPVTPPHANTQQYHRA